MGRATKTDQVVARVLNGFREEPEAEAAMLAWFRSRYGGRVDVAFGTGARIVTEDRAPDGSATFTIFVEGGQR